MIHGIYTVGTSIDDHSSCKISFIIVRDVIGRLVPCLATPIFYYKLYCLLKDSSDVVSFSRQALLRLFWYSTIPLVCALPGILKDINSKWSFSYFSMGITTIVMILRYFWEFLNLWAYYKLNPKNGETPNSRTTSRAYSSYSQL